MRGIRYAAIALMLAIMAWAQNAGTGTVRGSVKRAGVAVAGARVVVDSAAVSSYSGTATTGAGGNFVVNGTPVGEFDVKIYDRNGELVASSRNRIAKSGDVVTISLATR